MIVWLLLAAGLPTIGPADAPAGDRKPALTPRLNPRTGESGASGAPWLDANGWRYRRSPAQKWVVNAGKDQGALAAAEAFAYRADVLVRTVPEDQTKVESLMTLLRRIPAFDAQPVADIALDDDGSFDATEALNLLNRRNLLYGPSGKIRVQPKGAAKNPSQFAYDVRRKIGDEHRGLRLYGSQVVLAHFESNGPRARLHLLNYGRGGVDGLRVRLRGHFQKLTSYGTETSERQNLSGFTEFTVQQLQTYAVIDLAP
jgi:hypothetical protein